MEKMFRQGNLLFVRINRVPEGAVERSDTVLDRGEATGHSHRFVGQGTVLQFGDRIILNVTGEASVVHEEHRPVTLPPGVYEVIRQREYQPHSSRFVLD